MPKKVSHEGVSATDGPGNGTSVSCRTQPSHRERSEIALSFIIPAFNEEGTIAATIEAIHENAGALPYEVIVVDNFSMDGTARVAAHQGAEVIRSEGTIGRLRNHGAQLARGSVVVFLDADVLLTPTWASHIKYALNLLNADPRVLTGSFCQVPSNASWLERSWFEPRPPATYLGTGHLIMSRSYFLSLEGFDESLITGEDHELSRRAIACGSRVIPDDRLRVEHVGFPRTISAFVKREVWHGSGDYQTLSRFVRSKVAIASSVFAIFHIGLILSILMAAWPFAFGFLSAIAILCLISAGRKFANSPKRIILANAGLYWFYYLGRAFALLERLASRGPPVRVSPRM